VCPRLQSCQEFQDEATACTLDRVQEGFQVSVPYKRSEKLQIRLQTEDLIYRKGYGTRPLEAVTRVQQT
jgi:hypothetical protein